MIGLGAASNLLRSFERRNFRFLWFSDALTGWAEQMEFVVLSWFVLIETNSPFMLGLFAALRFSGTLFAPFYGIMTDRYDRKTLLVIIRAGFGIIAAIVLILALTSGLDVWHVFLFVGVSGMGRAFDNVARQSLIPDIVERARLANAVALTRTARDITQMIGPVIGGFMLSQAGMGPSYVLIVAVYLASVLATFRLSPPKRTPTAVSSSVLANLIETGKYIRKEEVVLALLLIAFLVNLTALPLNNGLMPVLARDVLGTDSSGLGILLGAYAVGGFLGSVTIAGIPQIRRPGRVVILGSIVWHIAILIISQMKWFSLSIPILALTGLSQSFVMVTMSLTLLSVTSPDIRGRVMGIRSLAVYGLPIGLLISGALADGFGVHVALIINAVVGILFTIVIAAWLRRLWHSNQIS